MKATKEIRARSRLQLAHDMLIASKDGYYPVSDVMLREYKGAFMTGNGTLKDESDYCYYVYMQKEITR